MLTPASEIMTIDAELARRRIGLRFPKKLEMAFRSETLRHRANRLILTGLLATVIDAAFLPADYLLMNDVFFALLIARLCIFTPLVYGVVYLIHGNPHKCYSDLIPSLFCVLVTALIMVIFSMSHSAARPYYLDGTFLAMMYGMVVQRQPFTYAIGTAVVCLAIQFGCVYAAHFNDPNILFSNVVFYCSGSVLLAITNYVLERADRKTYLLSARARLLNMRLEEITKIDPLTGLGNRRMFEEATTAFWSSRDGVPRTASLILLDVDRFKLYNDLYGHLVGDQCLSKISGCLLRRIRPGHVAVRFGGEEMLVFLPDTDFTEARQIAEQFRLSIKAVAMPHEALGERAIVTASFGVATALTSDLDVRELLACADMALYAAKRSGRDRVWPPLTGQSTQETDEQFTLAV